MQLIFFHLINNIVPINLLVSFFTWECLKSYKESVLTISKKKPKEKQKTTKNPIAYFSITPFLLLSVFGLITVAKLFDLFYFKPHCTLFFCYYYYKLYLLIYFTSWAVSSTFSSLLPPHYFFPNSLLLSFCTERGKSLLISVNHSISCYINVKHLPFY